MGAAKKGILARVTHLRSCHSQLAIDRAAQAERPLRTADDFTERRGSMWAGVLRYSICSAWKPGCSVYREV